MHLDEKLLQDREHDSYVRDFIQFSRQIEKILIKALICLIVCLVTAQICLQFPKARVVLSKVDQNEGVLYRSIERNRP